MKSQPSESGFTLHEMLIVVVVLGIIAAVAVPRFSKASSDARLESLQFTLETVRVQMQMFRSKNELKMPSMESSDGFVSDMTTSAKGGPFLERIPRNPFNNDKSVKLGALACPGDNSSGWWIDTRDGSFWANDNVDGVNHRDL